MQRTNPGERSGGSANLPPLPFLVPTGTASVRDGRGSAIPRFAIIPCTGVKQEAGTRFPGGRHANIARSNARNIGANNCPKGKITGRNPPPDRIFAQIGHPSAERQDPLPRPERVRLNLRELYTPDARFPSPYNGRSTLVSPVALPGKGLPGMAAVLCRRRENRSTLSETRSQTRTDSGNRQGKEKRPWSLE